MKHNINHEKLKSCDSLLRGLAEAGCIEWEFHLLQRL